MGSRSLPWRTAFIVVAAGLALAGARSRAAQSPADLVTFRIIVVSSIDRAERVVEQLTVGGDFIALARSESIDPSADAGGLIGPVERAALRPELRDALTTLAVGQTSAVVRVPTGFALVQRVETPPSHHEAIGTGEIPALAAVGGIKFTLGVDGFAEANSALEGYAKPADWNQSPRMMCEMRQQSLARSRGLLTQFLGPDGESSRAANPPLDLVEAYFALGQLHAYEGAMDKATEQFERAYAFARKEAPTVVLQLEEALGIAYFHKAEIENGVYREPGDRCLLPTRTPRPFANSADLQKSIDHFHAYLEQQPNELEVKWLLNLAYMSLGGYPNNVPPQHLIPPTALESANTVGRFVDVAVDAGLASLSSAGGVAVDDFDNDGRLDILTSNFDSCGEMKLFSRGGAGPFSDRAKAAGLGDELGGLNLAQADYNNDGCRDVLVMRGGWEIAQRRSLLRNNCDGTFTDVTEASGLARPATSSQTAAWADIDNDGFLDLFVGNEDRPAQLFRNRGDGTFEDIAEAAGVNRTAFTKGVAAADYDNDGFPDLYVSNLGGGNFLYHNNRNRTFTEVARTAGVLGADRGFPTWFFDYDNDGWQDLLVSSYFLSIDETVRTYLGLPHNATTMKLYRNMGDGTFRDVSAQAGLSKVYMPMGSNFGDIDNDGFLDIFLGVGSPSYAALGRSVLLRNADGKSFVDVTASSGTGELHKGHAVAFADLDYDGDEDIVFKVGGATPGDAHALRLFQNPGSGNDWIALDLVGVKTNRAAIGARIVVTVENEGRRPRRIHRTVSTGGSFGASPLQQHIGLGRAARIVDVDIWWPTSNTRQHFANVGKNQTIEIKELAPSYTRLERVPLPLVREADAR